MEALAIKADVSDDEACKRTIEETVAKWGRIDSLVNNAGTTKFVFDHSNLEGLDAEDFLHIYKVNVVGPFQMVRACKEYLLKSDIKSSGHICLSEIAAILLKANFSTTSFPIIFNNRVRGKSSVGFKEILKSSEISLMSFKFFLITPSSLIKYNKDLYLA